MILRVANYLRLIFDSLSTLLYLFDDVKFGDCKHILYDHSERQLALGIGIADWGKLTMEDSTISGNSARYGGSGLYNMGTTNIKDSTVSGNTAMQEGGGINNYGTATVTNCDVSANSAQSGGGILNSLGSMVVEGSTISDSIAQLSGGIDTTNYGKLTVTDSTISKIYHAGFSGKGRRGSRFSISRFESVLIILS